jgi:hypothetical protein
MIVQATIPAPATKGEHGEARSTGKALNPVYTPYIGSSERLDIAPDSRLVDPLMTLSRALWAGEACAVEIPAPTTDAERRLLERVADVTNPYMDSVTLSDTAIGAALADLHYEVRAMLRGTTASAERHRADVEDALFGVYFVTNVDRDDDKPLMWPYEAALLKGDVDRHEIAAMRERLRTAFARAEHAMDLADEEIDRRHGESERRVG